MTTLAELVAATPAATRGTLTQIAHGAGNWRFVVELADPSAGVAVVWYDITDDVAGYRCDRGADQYAGRYTAAVASLELIADDDRWAPWNEDTSPWFGTHVDLGVGLLIRAGFIRVDGGVVVEWLPRFTNRVESWSDAGYARGQLRRHMIVTRDLIGGLVNVPVPTQVSENWYTRIGNVLTGAGWDYGSTIYGAQLTSGAADILTLPARSEQGSAINELDATLDPAGIVWRTDRTGLLIAHEQAGDTFHADAFTAGATGTAYPWPAAVQFSYLADDTPGLVAYAVDGQVEPFGFDSTELGIVNRLVVSDTGTYDIDDPTSIARHGYRPRGVTWQADNDAVADDILARLAFATVEARPLTTTVDHPGFMAYATGLDFLSPVTIQHISGAGRSTVTGTGYVRTVTEQVAPRGNGVAWTLTMIADIDATEQIDELNPVTSLAVGSITDTTAQFTWVNPAQTITPTGTQVRMGVTSIWTDIGYPQTVVNWVGLYPLVGYEFEIRLIREVDGIITNVSPVERVSFTTLATTVPAPTPVPGGFEVTFPTPGTGCTVEWVLEESSGSATWSTADSGSISAAPWTATIPNTSFTTQHVYRIKSREVCSGVPGAYVYGAEFVHECTTPVVIDTAVAPYDDASLIAYVPVVCPLSVVSDSVNGSASVHGPAYGGLLARWDEGGDVALVASGDGMIAAGGALDLDGWTGDGTISCVVNIDNAAYVTVFTAGPMKLNIAPSAGGWKPTLIVTTAAGQLTIQGSEIAEGIDTYLAGTYDESTGEAALYVNAAADGTVGSTPGPMLATAPLWYVGGSDGSWVTECAVWSSVIGVPAPPITSLYDAIMALSPVAYWPLDDAAGPAADATGNGHSASVVNGSPTFQGELGGDGNYYISMPGSPRLVVVDAAVFSIGTNGMTVFALCKPTSVGTTSRQHIIAKGTNPTFYEWGIDINTVSAARYSTWVHGPSGSNFQSEYVTSLMTTAWQAIACQFPDWTTQGTRYSIYRNGSTALTSTQFATTSAAPIDTTSSLTLGGRNDGNGPWNGALAHIAIFDGIVDLSTVFAAAAADGWY